MDTAFRLKVLSEFLIDDSFTIWPGHEEHLLEMKSTLEKYINLQKIQSQHGVHFSNCEWAFNDTASGSDTCGCRYFEKKWLRALEIINFYYGLKYKIVKNIE